MGNQNTIVLNGKLYDAVTGKLVHDQATIAPKTASPTVKKNKGLVMDGVVRHPKKHGAKHIKHAAKKPAEKPSHPHREHKPTHAKRHQPQKAATLMRHAVSRPAHRQHRDEKPTSVHDERTKQRLERAKAVPKSHHIARFPKHAAQRPVPKTHAPLKVEDAPKTEPAVTHNAHQPTHAPAHQMSESEKLVTNALKHARTHETKAIHKKRRRMFSNHTANIAMGGLVVLLLVGFFVYQNLPNLSMQVASQRAGFAAQQPGYRPAGFSQEKLVTYSPGKVTISFHSNSDDREFAVTQQVSNWNSQALAENFLAKNDKQYETYQAGGKTVYIYGNGSATWVNGGVWYQIDGPSSLNSDQLLRIASSL